ncbi:MAG TPA: YqaE/Pmp3 family membrane protein [Smithellaceae bacterium]|nr:YqaE/Pmp3 family membrane protein [Smithellaceae bacterium]HRS90333.1 YqaE/Pmp3 family membrane protein [Smithellaceae bacterium]HRV27121.1 YqaE/Pmp3 family membrane protein [Smithellaceae bacterium]
MATKKKSKKPAKKSVKKSAGKSKKINPIVLFILAIIVPPLAVYLVKGAKRDFVINIVLCLFFWIPGIVHALWVVTK